MSWVRSDDRKPLNRKVRPLSDGAYRLDDHALHYCARHETDGVIHLCDMEEILLGLKGKQHAAYIAELIGAGLWHAEAESCDSRECPASEHAVARGTWVKHDYFVYNKRHSELEAARQSDRNRKRNPAGIRTESEGNPNTPSRPVPSRPVEGVENPLTNGLAWRNRGTQKGGDMEPLSASLPKVTQ